MRTRFVCLLSLLIFVPNMTLGHGQVGWRTDNTGREIRFPDTAEYQVLVTDLHTHSVFSDGHVWPNVRVAEAARDGVDVLAITEHLEYQPHQRRIPNQDRNAAFQEAISASFGTEVMVIAGAELTRGEPMGHMNAVFIKDANPLLPVPQGMGPEATVADRVSAFPEEDAVAEANRQGAFVFWNHAWGQESNLRTALRPFQRSLIRQKQLHGIEVANGGIYNAEAHEIALKHGLTLIGTSDVHGLIDWDYDVAGDGHRPVTLVLSASRSADSIREALFAGRTVIWSGNTLIGLPTHLNALLDASLTLESTRVDERRDIVYATLRNHSDARFLLRHTNHKNQSFHVQTDLLEVPPHESLTLTIKPRTMGDKLDLRFEVLNALTAPGEHPQIRRTALLAPRPEPATSYTHDEPRFRIAFPRGTVQTPPTSQDQLFNATSPEGVTFQVFASPLAEGQTLESITRTYMEGIVEAGIGRDFSIERHEPTKTKDGHDAYRSTVHWFFIPAGVALRTQMLTSVQNGVAIWSAAHPLADSEAVDKIVESLTFPD
ncbi:MAG: Sb-PDE family phosphodiesterase [Pseudomonadota bacterium]